jgi:internalin A
LNLSGTSITDQGVAHLARLERLEVLGLQGTAITDAGLATVKLLRSLKMLILDGTSIGDAGISNLAAMPELRHLSLNDTAITDAAMSSIASCDKLELLSLANTAIGDPGVEMLADNLREVQVLVLDETQITDGSLRRLSRFTRLWWLGIYGCVNITDAGVQELANVPDLTLLFVALGNPGITREGLSDLSLTTQGTISIE